MLQPTTTGQAVGRAVATTGAEPVDALGCCSPQGARPGTDVDVLVIGAGQAGLAAGYALRRTGVSFTLVDAAAHVGGSWAGYYDSLTLFSPAGRSALPGLPFPGDPGRYPHRDEVAAYLRRYAEHFALPVRTGTRVQRVRWDGAAFSVSLAARGEDGARSSLRAGAVIAASGGFGAPHLPDLPGAREFGGQMLHVGRYRSPTAFAGQRVVVVGAGNSAVQVATELAEVATVTLASRAPVRWRSQRPLGVDVHHWTRFSGVEALPLGRHAQQVVGVLDDGRYRAALAAGRPGRRPMFTTLTPTGVRWADGVEEDVDTVVLATGYRPDLGYLRDLVLPDGRSALDARQDPMHRRGVSTTVPGLGYVGLPGQHGLASATLRGAGPDARRVVRRLTDQLRRRAPTPAPPGPASRTTTRPDPRSPR
ncbi:putative flavoprotein involved in K+ transport [Kineococcus xinjiangensis]|uniref:Putative flavoprotein involved in K+ transport n=1 Tax=Kineococcus xinjiangensis TaxID=512762 RepID=A0A2S6IMF4_9ACTN|nr:NAD(P)/FAD-dependent oxidoreductase [Kineococcus xinjiangensis]PPK95417.1 putative flavoprotein involved in K+ transport [Kineococcus xinjiangensis]